MSEASALPCPCGRGQRYAECCEPLHAGEPAPTAERLMRSRYSAFALGLVAYLLDSWHPSTRPESLELDSEVEWRRLLVETTERGGPFDREGFVVFTAIGRTPEGRFEQRERSRFLRDRDGLAATAPERWRYVDGDPLDAS